MVMAAGLGKRMRPLTASMPKPLVKVAGKPLINHCLDRLADGGIERAVVNVHYLADSLEAHLRALRTPLEIVISDEREELLETGGGLVKALPLIDADPFFCVNSDNIWVNGAADSLNELRAAWDAERMDALLLLVPHMRAFNYSGIGDFRLDSLGQVSRRAPGKVAPFVYTGIQLLSRSLLSDPPGDAFSTNIFWDRAIAAGRLFGIVHQGLWFDVGTPGAIAPTTEILTRG
ncbi:MAG: nucleotidyltransferase family protein [Blastomonas sp.]